MKILIIEDEVKTIDYLKRGLTEQGYSVDAATDGPDGLHLASTGDYDAIILDIMLPGLDGISLLKSLRPSNNTPVIMLTAKDAVASRLEGFQAGADDYLVKPFSFLELLARLQVITKRVRTKEQTNIYIGDLHIDLLARRATRGSRRLDLTAKEYDLIELLMKNPRRVYSRESLMNLVWGYSYAGDYRTVDVHIRRLREKLERVPAEPEYIMTKWGVGYYFAGENQPTV